MNLTMGNKNVVVGFLVILIYFSMTFFIEKTTSMHQFHDKAAAVVIDAKGTPDLLDDQVVDMKKGPAYRTGGLYFTNYYPASYVRVSNSGREAGYNMRLYAWIFALFNIAIGVIVGLQSGAGVKLRAWASWLAVAGVVLYPIRDTVSFWCRWFSVSAPSSVLYPIKWVGGAAMFLALLMALIVFMQGTREARAK
ncbi:MAG: hypothetical protein C0390_02495 [Syntrophus sp. (in: bacteria)]|nr:hypothetical protein [Syntrophus sp. (in: bacteria)]